MNFLRFFIILHCIVNLCTIARHTGRAIFDARLQAKSEAHAVGIVRVVVVGVAIVVDVAEVVAIRGVWRAQPPVVGGSPGDTCGI